MIPLVWLYIVIIIVPVAYLGWSVISVDRASQALIRTNLTTGLDTSVKPAGGRGAGFAALARRLTPAGYIPRLDKLLAMAGRPASIPLERLLVLKPVFALAAAALGGLFYLSTGGPGPLLLALFLITFAYFLPDLLVYNKGIKRQEQIQLELPNVLDQMLISVEAGLGFEAAMARVGANGKSELSEEMTRTLQDIQAGRSRREAYQAMSARSTVKDLRSFVGAVVQADLYGIGLSRVLRTQAAQMRIKRRQRAEEKAMKLPVKILFPLLLFIFPTLFLVILGPAAINIMESGFLQ